MNLLFNSFLLSRRGEDTKYYSKKIFEEIKASKNIQTKTLLSKLVPSVIPNASTLFMLLNSLQKYGVIEKSVIKTQTPGRSPTYYRIKEYT